MSPSDTQIIFSLIGVGRVYPPKKQVLKDIYLSFYYGAKIGVLGLNGAGKSTVLRIIAGVDKDYLGEVTFSKGYTVGLLEQEPQLDKGKTVKEIVEEGRRDALCRLLIQEPDILLLDEPTNHLDAESVQWLEQHLQQYKGTVIAVTHDRYFLDNVAGWILELDRGHGMPFEGNYSSWLEQKQARLVKEEKA